MKTKWYLSALIVVFALIGLTQNNTSLPNQEVNVHFNTQNVTANQSKTAIALIKEQLEVLGVKNIQVTQSPNQQLKIKYYSSKHVVLVKQKLQNVIEFQLNLLLNNQDHHNNQETSNINLDVVEISPLNKNTSNSAGKSILVVKQDLDRSTTTNIPVGYFNNVFCISNSLITKKVKITSTSSLVVKENSYAIPEVRAGPLS